jgi:hypothetical protein
MKKHLSLLTAGLLVLLFTACGDSIIEANDSPISTNASIKIQVLDQISKKPLPGATVTLLSTGNTQTTDGNGAVIFKDMRVGTYGYQVDFENYASAIQQTIVSSAGGNGSDILVATETFASIGIYELNCGLQGSLNYVAKDNKRLPANGATVRITLNNPNSTTTNFVNTIYETTVENGKYYFESLPPVGTSYTIEALDASLGGDVYRTFTIPNTNTSLRSAFTSNLAVTEYPYTNRVVPGNLYITEYKEHVADTESVVFKFSEAVDVSKSNVRINGRITTSELVAAIGWSNGNKTLTISPVVGTISTSWKEDFTVVLNPFVTANNASLPQTNYPIALKIDLASDIAIVKCDSINGVPELCFASNTPQDLALTDADGIKISWQKIQGATSYRVYAKASAGENYFIKVGDVTTDLLAPSYRITSSDLVSKLNVKTTKNPLGVEVLQPFTKVVAGVATAQTLEIFVQPIRSVPNLYYAEGSMAEASATLLTLSGAIPVAP